MTAARLRATAARLREATTPVTVIAEDLVVAPAALAPITEARTTAVLVRPAASDGDARVRHHILMSAGSTHHRVGGAGHRMVGALSIAPVDGPRVAEALETLAAAVESGAIDATCDESALTAVAIVRAGVSAQAVEMVDVPWYRGDVDPEHRAAALAVPADRIARLQANRLDDGLYSTFVVRRLSKPLTRLALRLGWTPNAITLISFAVGIAAAVAFAGGTPVWLVLGALLLQASLVIDCVDGEVARATRRFSALGAWLDASTDRVKEFLAYAGLAIGAARVRDEDLWPIALVLVVLVTTRHMADYDFSRVQRQRETRLEPRDPLDPSDGSGASTSAVAAAMERSARLNRRDAVRWAKRAIHLPIGERWLILSVLAAVAGARWALLGLLIAALIAFAYVTTGRVLRTLTWRGSAPLPAAVLLARQSDAGPIASTLSRGMSAPAWLELWSAPWAWAIPTSLRFLELGFVALVVFALAPSLAVLGFIWAALVAFHHYDVLYRAMQDQPTPRWLTWAGLGWDGRSLLLAAGAMTGILGGVLVLGAGAWAMLLVVIASAQWLASGAGRS